MLVAATQTVVAISLGDAEFDPLLKIASGALGAVSTVADMAKVVKPRVRVDATAPTAIASRRGVGIVRQFYSQGLQQELTIARVTRVRKLADEGTKHVVQKEMHEHMRRSCQIVG